MVPCHCHRELCRTLAKQQQSWWLREFLGHHKNSPAWGRHSHDEIMILRTLMLSDESQRARLTLAQWKGSDVSRWSSRSLCPEMSWNQQLLSSKEARQSPGHQPWLSLRSEQNLCWLSSFGCPHKILLERMLLERMTYQESNGAQSV